MRNKADIRPYSPKDLSAFYHLSPKELRQMLKPHKNLIGKKLSSNDDQMQLKYSFYM